VKPLLVPPVRELSEAVAKPGPGLLRCGACAGLVAGGQFQPPPEEGAECMTFQHSQTLFGPQAALWSSLRLSPKWPLHDLARRVQASISSSSFRPHRCSLPLSNAKYSISSRGRDREPENSLFRRYVDRRRIESASMISPGEGECRVDRQVRSTPEVGLTSTNSALKSSWPSQSREVQPRLCTCTRIDALPRPTLRVPIPKSDERTSRTLLDPRSRSLSWAGCRRTNARAP